MSKRYDNNHSMSTTLIQTYISFEDSIKTSCQFKDVKKEQLKKLQEKNKQLQFLLRLKQIKFNQLQRCYQVLQKQLRQKQQQIEILIDKIYKLNRKIKTQKNEFKNTLLYIQQQVKNESSIKQEIISNLTQQNLRLKMEIQKIQVSFQSKSSSNIIQSEFQQQAFHEIKNLGSNLFNQYIWKLQQLFSKHFKQQNRLKAVVLPLFKSVFQQNNSANNIIISFEQFLINLVQYQKHIQQREFIEQYITDFVAEIEGKNLLQDSQEESLSFSKSRRIEN